MSGDLHPSGVALKALGCPLSEDDFDLIAKAMPFTDNLPPHPSAAEVEALLGLLPENGDTAAGQKNGGYVPPRKPLLKRMFGA